MPIKILFEQIENSTPQLLSDCELQSISIKGEPKDGEAVKPLILYRDGHVGTDIQTVDKCCGPSVITMNQATKYEFQKLNATQIHRAINDPKLGEFLVRIYPLLKEELDDSDLFNKL